MIILLYDRGIFVLTLHSLFRFKIYRIYNFVELGEKEFQVPHQMPL